MTINQHKINMLKENGMGDLVSDLSSSQLVIDEALTEDPKG